MSTAPVAAKAIRRQRRRLLRREGGESPEGREGCQAGEGAGGQEGRQARREEGRRERCAGARGARSEPSRPGAGAPIICEKATIAADKHNQVLFKVLRDATKPEIKAAVELMFKVDVESVQTVQHKGKQQALRQVRSAAATTSRRPTCRSQAGQELNFSGEGA